MVPASPLYAQHLEKRVLIAARNLKRPELGPERLVAARVAQRRHVDEDGTRSVHLLSNGRQLGELRRSVPRLVKVMHVRAEMGKGCQQEPQQESGRLRRVSLRHL